MAITVVFIIVLFSVGLRANTDGKVIQDEMKLCEQDDVTLSCGAASSDNRWKIRTSYGRRTKVPDIPSKYSFNNGSLIIKHVQNEDTKSQYICSTTSPVHHYRITYVYTLKIVCKDIEAYAGSVLDLKCNVDIPDNDISRIDWKFRYKHHRKDLTSDHRTSMSGKILSIKDVDMSDSGTFTCIAARKAVHRSRESYFYNLLVKKAPQTTSAATTALSETTVLPTTASTTGRASTITTEDVTRKPSTTLPPFPIFSTTTNTGPVSEGMTIQTYSTDSETLKETLTVTMKPTPKPVRPSLTDENTITEILPATLNPKHRARTTQSNSIDSENDNQLGGKAPTTKQNSGNSVTISATTLVWLCVAALLPFYLT